MQNQFHRVVTGIAVFLGLFVPLVTSAAAVTNTVVLSSANPATIGNTISIVAAVAPSLSSLTQPTGWVTFTVDGVVKPAATLVNGLTTISISSLTAGNHTITASYGGDGNYAASASQSFTQVVNATYVTPWQAGIDVTKFGIKGDGVTDNTVALQNLINSSAPGTAFYFPKGTYLVNSTIAFGAIHWSFAMRGDVAADGSPASIIKSTSATGAAVSADYGTGAGSFQVANMQFIAPDSGGTGFYTVNAQSSSFENCYFSGHIGLDLESGFVVSVRSSKFIGHGGAAGSHIGLIEWGATGGVVTDSDFSGWDEGMRAAGGGLGVNHSTFEHNGTGMNLGASPTGGSWILAASDFSDISMGSNDVGITMPGWSVALSSFTNINIQGDTSAPSGQSRAGVLVGTQTSNFSGVHVSGSFSDIGFRITPSSEYSTLYGNTVTNSLNPSAVWDVATGLNQVFVNSNPFPAVNTTPVDDVTAAKLVAAPQTNVIDVTKYGVVGNNTDTTAAIQSLINTAAAGTIFYFPRGFYRVSATLDFSRLSNFSIVGDVSSTGSDNGSEIAGYFTGPLIKADYGNGAGTFQIRNISLRASTSPGGIAVYSKNSVLASMIDTQTVGNIGVQFDNATHLAIRNNHPSSQGLSVSRIGILIAGGMYNTVDNADINGWQEGLRASGLNFALYSSRTEVNHIALNLGVDANGNNAPLQNASIVGAGGGEGNDIGVIVADCINCSFGPTGSSAPGTEAPAGMSQVGVLVGASRNLTFAPMGNSGEYSVAGVVVQSTASNVLFDASRSDNTAGTSWIIDPNATNITFVSTNYVATTTTPIPAPTLPPPPPTPTPPPPAPSPTPTPTTCTENWSCSSWSTCTSSGFQTRTCTDLNHCATNLSVPATVQACTPTPTPSTFSIGTRVKTIANLNVRSKASNGKGIKILCTQPAGSLGTIKSGPSNAGGYLWWNINYDTKCDGWSVQNYLTATVAETAPESQVASAAQTLDVLNALEVQLRALLLQLQGR